MDTTDDQISDRRLEKLRGLWFEDGRSEMRERIIQCVSIGISNESPSIRSMCAASIVMIMRLDESKGPYFVENLITHILNEDVELPLKQGSLRTFVELLDAPVLTNDLVSSTPQLLEDLRRLLFVVKMLTDYQYDQATRIDAAKFIFNMTKTLPCVICEEVIVTDLVTSLASGISCTGASARVPEELFFMTIQCLSKLAELCYHVDTGSVLQLIGTTVTNAMESHVMNEKAKALCFWRDMAKFEIDIMNQDPAKCRYFVSNFHGLADILCNTLSCVGNRYDQDIEEDFNDTEPHMIAQVVLKIMYMFNQEAILDAVASYFERASGSSLWQEVHGAILAVTVVCSQPVLDRAFEFVCQVFEGLISFASGCMENDRIRESAIWAIGQCIKEYPTLLQAPNAMDILVDMLTKNIPGPLAAMRRGYNIIGWICLHSCHEDLEPHFESFMNLIWPMVSEMNPEKYARNAFYAMNALIRQSSDDYNELFAQWIPGLLGRLGEDLNYESKVGICSSLSVIVRKIGGEIQHGGEIIKTMIDCLSAPDCMIMEEALNTISCVLRCIRPGEVFVENVHDAIMEAIDSQIPSVWGPAFGALGDLFCIKRGEMDDMADRTLMRFVEFVNSEGPSNENVLPELVKCVAMIIYSCGDAIGDDARRSAVEMINLISTIEIEGRGSDLIIPLYINIVRCYANIYSSFSEDTRLLIRMSDKAFLFVEKIWKNDLYTIDASILLELYRMFHRAGEALEHRINVKLNKKYVQNLVMAGLQGPEGDINVEASRIKAFIEKL